MKRSKAEDLLKLTGRKAVLRPRDLEEAGIPRNYLGRLVQRGIMQKLQRGLYAPTGFAPSENQSLIEVAQKIPRAVICLLSALRFHDIGTQNPSEVWIALDVKARKPKIAYPPLRVVRFSGEALTFGVTEQRLKGEVIRITSPAKTTADCFKFRNKIGLDVALEALREVRLKRKASVDEIWEAAKICRVANVIRPYMESLS